MLFVGSRRTVCCVVVQAQMQFCDFVFLNSQFSPMFFFLAILFAAAELQFSLPSNHISLVNRSSFVSSLSFISRERGCVARCVCELDGTFAYKWQRHAIIVEHVHSSSALDFSVWFLFFSSFSFYSLPLRLLNQPGREIELSLSNYKAKLRRSHRGCTQLFMRNVSYLALRPARSNTGVVSSHFMFFRQTWDGLSSERDFSIRSNHRVDLDSALSCAAATAAACKSLKSTEYSLIRMFARSPFAFIACISLGCRFFKRNLFFSFSTLYSSRFSGGENIDYHVYMFASERRFVFFVLLCSSLSLLTTHNHNMIRR